MKASETTYNDVTKATVKRHSNRGIRWMTLEVECANNLSHTVVLWGESMSQCPPIEDPEADANHCTNESTQPTEDTEHCPECGSKDFNPNCDECIDAKAQEDMRTDDHQATAVNLKAHRLPVADEGKHPVQPSWLVGSYMSALRNAYDTCGEYGCNGEPGTPDAEDIMDTNVNSQVDQLAGQLGHSFVEVLTWMEDQVNDADKWLDYDPKVGDLVLAWSEDDDRNDLHGGLANFVVGRLQLTFSSKAMRHYCINVGMEFTNGIPKWVADEQRTFNPPVNGVHDGITDDNNKPVATYCVARVPR